MTPLDSAEVERRDAAWRLTGWNPRVAWLPVRMMANQRFSPHGRGWAGRDSRTAPRARDARPDAGAPCPHEDEGLRLRLFIPGHEGFRLRVAVVLSFLQERLEGGVNALLSSHQEGPAPCGQPGEVLTVHAPLQGVQQWLRATGYRVFFGGDEEAEQARLEEVLLELVALHGRVRRQAGNVVGQLAHPGASESQSGP
ncbi:hypothetical protein SAMN05444383_112147 [Myxococcus xanthus]|nr:hypothetical protein SAMN05444383_112147 [Myxococcus xanthus]